MAAAWFLLAGCAETPTTSSGEILDLRELSREFWSVDGDTSGPPIEDPRVAIAEFTVEYVAASAAEGAPAPDFGTSMKLELPGVLYRNFAETLPKVGRYPIPPATVSEAEALQRLAGARFGEAKLLEATPVAGLGYPAEGLVAIEGAQADVDAVLRNLIEEVGADVAFQVRLRLGVRDGRAAIEKGSTYRAVARAKGVTLTSQKTFLGARRVVSADGTAIDSHKFVEGIQAMLRTSLVMALVAADRFE
jgi:hypothetical protein